MLNNVVCLAGPRRLRAENSTLAVVVVATVVSLAVFFSAAAANAGSIGSRLTLDDLVNDQLTLVSDNEEVVFSNFQVETTPGWGDLTDYIVLKLWSGFEIFGPRPQAGGGPLEITLNYDVATLSDTRALAMTGANFGQWGDAHADDEVGIEAFNGYGGYGEEILDPYQGPVGSGGWKMDGDAWVFADMVGGASVTQIIRIGELYGLKGKWGLRTRFTTEEIETPPVPEPSTALMLGIGMAGLAYCGRRKARRA